MKLGKLNGIKTGPGCERQQEGFLQAGDERKTRENVSPLLNKMGDLIMQGVGQGWSMVPDWIHS